ncbi:hypothetical protein STEG23_005292, partial [Scotinomys teguina]
TQLLESLSKIQKMESLSDTWMSLSSIFLEMDVIFGVMCGVGLFFLLTPFLKTYPVSPPPGSGKDTPKVRRRRQSKARKKNASVKALPLGQGPPQISQAQPLPQLVTSCSAAVKEVQTLDDFPSSTPNQALSASTSRICGKACPTRKTRIQASLPTENQPWQQDLEWKDTIGSNVQKHQAAISQPAHNLPRDISPAEVISLASILLRQCQFLQHHEEPQSEYRMTKVREQGPTSRVLPSQELTRLQGHFPANSHRQSKNKPELPQFAQPAILDSRSCKLSQMMESVPSEMPSKKGPAKCNIHDPIEEGPSFRAKGLPCTSSSTPGQGLEPRNPQMRTDQLSHVNTTQDLSFLDSQTQRNLDSSTKQLPVKRRWKSYLQTLVSRDLIQSLVPASSFPQPVYPSSSSSVSKLESWPKTATVLEKLHHQDPGGTRVETVSAARLQSPLFAHSPSEVQEMQRASPPADSHRPPKAHPVTQLSNLSTRAKAYCLLARTQKIRIVQGVGRGSLQPSTGPRIVMHESWKMSKNVASIHPCWSGTMVDPEVRTPSSGTKQTNRIVEVIKETPSPWKGTLGASKIPNGQNINNNLRDFEYVEANRNPGHLQICPQNSSDPVLKSQVVREVDFRSNKQPQSCPDGLLSDCQSAMCPITVSFPTQHSVPRLQSGSPNPKTSQGLDDVFKMRDHNRKTQKLSVPKNEIQASNHKIFPPSEERKDCMRSRVKSQGGNLGRMGLSQAWGLNSSTQPKDTVITESQPSSDMLENKQAPVGSFLNKVVRNILQYLSLSTKVKKQGDSLKNESLLPPTIQIPEVDTKEKLIYNMAVRVQSLVNVVIQVLVDRLGLGTEDPSKVQWCKLDSLISQLDISSEGLYDRKESKMRRMSFGPHTSSKGHNYPGTYRGTGDKWQLSADAQRACDQHQNRVKREMDFNQLPTPKGKTQPCRYRRTGDKQQSGPASKTACDPDQIKVKSGMGYCPHSNPKRHSHSFLYTEIGSKQQPGIVHGACDPHQSTKKVSGYDYLNSLKKNDHPVMYRGTGDKEQSCADTQRAGHPKCTIPAQAKVQVPQARLTFSH